MVGFRVVRAIATCIGLVSWPSLAAAQNEPGSVRAAAFVGYSFSDLNKPLIGVSADVVVRPFWALTAAASDVFVGDGALSQFELALRWSPFAGLGQFYVEGGPFLSRSSTSGGGRAVSDIGAFGLAGVEVRLTHYTSFVELLALKDGAVSGQIRGGVRVRIR